MHFRNKLAQPGTQQYFLGDRKIPGYRGVWISFSAALLVSMGFLSSSSVNAHAVFAAPKKYLAPNAKLKLDLSPQVQAYVKLGERMYRDSANAARKHERAIDTFLAKPNADTLELAKKTWIEARRTYIQTEVFRFNDGPIDAPATADREEGPEMRINAWPLNEAFIDYVRGEPNAGLINEKGPVTKEQILANDQSSDESNVTTGWHAVEFLLWGQDFNVDGPGKRSWKDYLPGNSVRENRRTYLRLVTQLLRQDLESLEQHWRSDLPTSYANQLLQMDPIEAVGRSLQGVTSLVAIELAGERLAVALDSRSQEDEHSCFSDTTHLNLIDDVRGVHALVFSEYEGEKFGASLIDVVNFLSPSLGLRLRNAVSSAMKHAEQLHQPFDQLILKPENSKERIQAEQTVAAMLELGRSLKASAALLELEIVVPGV